MHDTRTATQRRDDRLHQQRWRRADGAEVVRGIALASRLVKSSGYTQTFARDIVDSAARTGAWVTVDRRQWHLVSAPLASPPNGVAREREADLVAVRRRIEMYNALGRPQSPPVELLKLEAELAAQAFAVARKHRSQARILADAAPDMLDVLHEVEFGGRGDAEDGGYADCCPSCGGVKGEGHLDECRLAAAIAKAEGRVK